MDMSSLSSNDNHKTTVPRSSSTAYPPIRTIGDFLAVTCRANKELARPSGFEALVDDNLFVGFGHAMLHDPTHEIVTPRHVSLFSLNLQLSTTCRAEAWREG
jgi:hypothetical protein